jgi:uncharacterized membrane-anchored protein
MRTTILSALAASVLLPAAALALTAAEYEALNEKIAALDWFIGETEHDLPRANAVVATGPDQAFLAASDANEYMRLTQGVGGYDLEGLIFTMEGPLADSVVSIAFDPAGYIVLDDWDEAIDSDDLMAQLHDNTRAANVQRPGGDDGMVIDGWAQEPELDRARQTVTWAVQGQDSNGAAFVSALALKLGRRGAAVIEWFGAPEQFESAAVVLGPTLEAFSYQAGSRYADFDPAVDAAAGTGIGALAHRMLTGESPAARLGLLAGALLLKKFWWVLLLPVAVGLVGWLRLRPRAAAAE